MRSEWSKGHAAHDAHAPLDLSCPQLYEIEIDGKKGAIAENHVYHVGQVSRENLLQQKLTSPPQAPHAVMDDTTMQNQPGGSASMGGAGGAAAAADAGGELYDEKIVIICVLIPLSADGDGDG